MFARGHVDRLLMGNRGCAREPGIGGSHFDPLRQVGNHRGRKLPLGRHLHPLDLVIEDLQEKALRRLAGNDHRPRFAPGRESFAAVDEETGLQFPFALSLGRMASMTVLHEDGPDLAFKEGELLRRRIFRAPSGRH